MKLLDLDHWDRGGFSGSSIQILKYKSKILFEACFERTPNRIAPYLLLQLSAEPVLEFIVGLSVFTLSFYILPRNYDYIRK